MTKSKAVQTALDEVNTFMRKELHPRRRKALPVLLRDILEQIDGTIDYAEKYTRDPSDERCDLFNDSVNELTKMFKLSKRQKLSVNMCEQSRLQSRLAKLDVAATAAMAVRAEG